MRSLLSFTVEHFLLFEATLLQYAAFAAAVTTPSNLSTSLSASACTGCGVAASTTLLRYTGDVHEVTSTQPVTVIPFVTIYEDGRNVTNYSTYTRYAPGSTGQGLATEAPSLTWETFGTTLTYPTTYIAYYAVSAGASSRDGSSCISTLSPAQIAPTDQARLVFPSSSGIDTAEITRSVNAVLDSLPTVSALVSPHEPATCAHKFGLHVLETPGAPEGTQVATATTPAFGAITHTSVRYLTSEGQAVITRATGNAPPPESQITNGGSSRPPANGGQGGNGGNNNQPTPPPINWGGSSITAGPSGVWSIGGQAVTAGGSAQVVDGTTVSIAAGGSAVVINGQTSSLTNAGPTSSGPALANIGVDGPVPVAITTWFAGIAIGFLGMFVGVYL